MAATVLHGTEGVLAANGTHLGYSDWLEVTQERIDLFAHATGSSAGHEFLTLSLSNMFLPQIVEVTGFSMGVNYGTGTVRFLTPVPAGARVRGGAELTGVTDVKNGLQTTMTITIEIEAGAGTDAINEPACVIDSISRWLNP